jgi:sulfhydrogenase subunit delta
MASKPTPPRPTLGVFKLASCDGCQLTLLNCEDELLAVVANIDIQYFPEATSTLNADGPFDLALIEGSVSTQEQLEIVHAVRARATHVVAIGACATAGGIQALRNWRDVKEFVKIVYAQPEYIDTLATVTPVRDHIPIDFELRGCPIDKGQLIELITALLVGRRPEIEDESVCMECKREGNICVTVARGEPCLGPVTHAGCGALCPRFDRGCYACFGPRESANASSLAKQMRRDGVSSEELVRRLRGFTGWAEPFRGESDKHEATAATETAEGEPDE